MNYLIFTLASNPFTVAIDWILGIFGKLLGFIDSFMPNYLFTILVFAILAKIVMFPLSIKQQKTTVKQAALKPKEMAIRKKYNGRTDQVAQQKMNEEILELQRSEGVTPFSGCLPLLVQLPVILGLYELIRNPLKYICGLSGDVITKIRDVLAADVDPETGAKAIKASQAAIEAAIKNTRSDLELIQILRENFEYISGQIEGGIGIAVEDIPNFSFFGLFDLSVTPNAVFDDISLIGYVLVPVITFVTMFLSMKLNKKLTYQPTAPGQDIGCAGKIMDYTMPLMSTWIAFIVPSMLGVYWMFNNLLGMLQSLILKKMYPLPVFTDEDYKAADREYRGKRPLPTAKDERVVEGKKYVSLHHIDDEDYDEKGTYIGKASESRPEVKEAKKDAVRDLPELQEDDRPHKNKK